MADKNKYNSEEFLYSLPDYVNGKLPDGPLKKGIEEMIKTDRTFRAEYESMLSTLKFVKDSSLEEPPSHYFNSLVPRINERIETGKTKVPALHPVFHLWRYIVPALTVILVMVIILRPEKENRDIITGDTQNITTVNTITSDTLTVSQDSEVPEEETLSAETEVTAPKIKALKLNKTGITENEGIIENITELFTEGDDSQEDSEEYYYESDFRNLSPSEQNEVLKNLSQAKF